MVTMCLRQIGRVLFAALIIAGGLLSAPKAVTSAQPCPDVEAVFARGTGEHPVSAGSGSHSSMRCARNWVPGRSTSIRSTTMPAAISPTASSSPKVLSTELETPVVISMPLRRTARRPGSCSGDIPRALPWPVSSLRLPYPREYLPSTRRSYPSRCRRRSPTTSPRSRSSGNRRLRGCKLWRAGDRHRPAVCAQDHRLVR